MNKPHATDREPLQPPQWPLKVLRFFLKKEYLEEIEGDMEELFRDNAEQWSPRQARRMYVWEMLRLFRPILMRSLRGLQQFNQMPMFKNYFKVSIRSLVKNPVNSFINVIGLALAIGISIFAYAFASWTYSTDQFHTNKEQVHLVTYFAEREGKPEQYGKTPRPLGELMRNDFTHIKKVCRIEDRNVVIKFEDKIFHERARFTDADFLDMFTFPLKWGTTESLADVNSIVLSEDMAVKYFGEANPVGQTLMMIFGRDHQKAFKVTAVAKEFPKSRSFGFNFLVNFENVRVQDPAYDFHDWSAQVNGTFIQVENPADVQTLLPGMEKYRNLQNEAVGEDGKITAFSFEPLSTLHERTEDIRDDIVRSSKDNYMSIIFMVVIAAFLMALACFNYINIAIVSVARRLKEIGVRKSIGATRRVVIVQFLAENIVITFFALALGLLIGATILIPGFEQLWDFDMDFRLNDPKIWIFLPAILLFTSIASGIYPAIYISKFQVVSILKGTVRFGQKSILTRVLLGFQLVQACIFIILSVAFSQNTTYLANRGWGYESDEALYAKLPDAAAYEKLSARMASERDVVSVSGSTHHVGRSNGTTIIHFPDRKFEVDQLLVDANYFATLGLQLKEGRLFKDHEGSDRNAVIVNENMVADIAQVNTDWQQPIGQVFRIDSVEYEVVGVLKEFHNYSFKRRVNPTIFRLADKAEYNFLSVKVNKGSEIAAYKRLQENWAELFPEIPFEGGHQEDVWGFYYETTRIYRLVWQVFASIAVALAGLGLYGLVRLNVAGRTKEFSIRKVLGATVVSIAGSITRQYVWLFGIALAIGGPLGYWLSKSIIAMTYAYHRPHDLTGVTIGAGIMVSILLAAVSTQVFKVAKANPVEGLKVE